MSIEPKKLNVIILAYVPEADVKDPSYEGYQKLEKSLIHGYNDNHNIIIISHDESSETPNDVNLYIIEKNAEGESKKVLLFNFGEYKFTSAVYLGVIFRHINQFYPASEAILLVFGHAYGVGLFKNKPVDKSVFIKEKSVAVAPSFNSDFFKITSNVNVLTDTKPIANNVPVNSELMDMLSIRELSDAINKGNFPKGNKPFGLIIFMACDLINIENIFSLRLRSNYIVGAQTPMHWHGYDYDSFFSSLNEKIALSETKIDYKKLGECLLDNYLLEKEYSHYKERTKISLISTEYMLELRTLLNDMVLFLLKNISTMVQFKEEMMTSEIPLPDTSNTWIGVENEKNPKKFEYNLMYRDLFNIITIKLKNVLEKNTIEKFETIKGRIVLKVTPTQSEKTKDLNGLSIIFPDKADLVRYSYSKDFLLLSGSANNTTFIFHHLWVDFLFIIYKYFNPPKS